MYTELTKHTYCLLYFFVKVWNLIHSRTLGTRNLSLHCPNQYTLTLSLSFMISVKSFWGAMTAVIMRKAWAITYLLRFQFVNWKVMAAFFFSSLFSSASLFLSRFLSAGPLSHQFNSGVLSKAFPQVVSLGQNPTPLSLVQLQQEGEDIFIGLRGDISMAAIVSRSRVN